MSRFLIEGGTALSGEVRIQGAKNSVLPILAATLLNRGVTVLRGCPRLRDVDASVKILRHLGCSAQRSGEILTVDTSGMRVGDSGHADAGDAFLRHFPGSDSGPLRHGEAVLSRRM